MSWCELNKLSKDELLRVATLYSNYIQEYMEKGISETGNQCVCLAEFYDYEYQDILQAEEEGLYDPKVDTWEFWAGYEED
ncbi:MAG: hypothetical protein WC175_05915 [Candidatus Dojkabacteria bacterium]